MTERLLIEIARVGVIANERDYLRMVHSRLFASFAGRFAEAVEWLKIVSVTKN